MSPYISWLVGLYSKILLFSCVFLTSNGDLYVPYPARIFKYADDVGLARSTLDTSAFD